jgi:peroxiredoxin
VEADAVSEGHFGETRGDASVVETVDGVDTPFCDLVVKSFGYFLEESEVWEMIGVARNFDERDG